MSTDLFAGVKYTDGEALDPNDLGNSQAFLAARLFDQLIGKCVMSDLTLGASQDPDFPSQFSTAHAYWALALSVGAGIPRQGSANNKVLISKGTIFQSIGSDTGTEPVLLPYTFGGTDEFTIANGDATNPRIDLLQCKLEWVDANTESRNFQDATTRALSSITPAKRRRVQATVNIKAGAPAATPRVPDCDSGFCALAMVLVGATYSGAAAFGDFTNSTLAHLFDARMPLNVRPHIVRPHQGIYDSTVWIATAGSTSPSPVALLLKCNTSTTGTDKQLIVMCPTLRGRIVGVAVECANGVATGIVNGALVADPVRPTALLDLSAALETSATMACRMMSLALLEGGRLGVPVAASTVQGLGLPLWANAGGRHVERFRLGSGVTPKQTQFALMFDVHSTMTIGSVTFYVAEGW